MQPSTSQRTLLDGLDLELVGVTRPPASVRVVPAVVPPKAWRRLDVGVTVMALIELCASDVAAIRGEENTAAAASAKDVRLAGVKRRRWVRGDASASSASIFSLVSDMCWDWLLLCAGNSRVKNGLDETQVSNNPKKLKQRCACRCLVVLFRRRYPSTNLKMD